jgi:hypothetical protein
VRDVRESGLEVEPMKRKHPDTERLDFLARHKDVDMLLWYDLIGAMNDKPGWRLEWNDGSGTPRVSMGRTPRQAIDAAMKAAAKEER